MFSGAAAMKRRQAKRTFAGFLLKSVNATKGCKAYRAFVAGKSHWKNIWEFLRYLPSDESRMVHAASFKCMAHLIPESMLSPEVREWKWKQEQRRSAKVEKFQKHQRWIQRLQRKKKAREASLEWDHWYDWSSVNDGEGDSDNCDGSGDNCGNYSHGHCDDYGNYYDGNFAFYGDDGYGGDDDP